MPRTVAVIKMQEDHVGIRSSHEVGRRCGDAGITEVREQRVGVIARDLLVDRRPVDDGGCVRRAGFLQASEEMRIIHIVLRRERIV